MAHKFRVALRITGDDFNPELLSKQLRVVPTEYWMRGDSKKNNRDVYSFSSWSLSSIVNDNSELEEHIDDIMNRIGHNIQYFKELDETYYLCLLCAVYVDGENLDSIGTPSIGLTGKQLQWLGGIDADFDVDLYIV